MAMILMQTFLPSPDFELSALILDNKRLGKQRVEAKTILSVIAKLETQSKNNNERIGWAHHPSVIMWRRFPDALKLYYNIIVQEWIKRGFRNSMPFFSLPEKTKIHLPDWLGFEQFHASHRANLLRKDEGYYSQFHWKEAPSDEYVWCDSDDKWFRLKKGTTTRKYF